MGLEERRIEISDLVPGMYVCRLDRPWEGAPFHLQGFLLESELQMQWLRDNCRVVWIDVHRGLGPPDSVASARPRREVAAEKLLGSVSYEDTATFEEELPGAQRAFANAVELTTRITDDLRAGHKLSMDDVNDAVGPVVQSVLRSADTMFWVNMLQQRGAYAYSHAINCSALAAAFGRHLGLPTELLLDLASGGLLLDIGKTQLPENLLNHPGPLQDDEMRRAREHVLLGQRILQETRGHSHEVLEMVRTHHERWDGSGYPDRLAGMSIPLYGRMAAIIDSFDAMTSPRPYAQPVARYEALRMIYLSRESLFQGELVEQFIGCLGVFPTGSLVELSTGEVGVVMAQNPTRRLRPKIMLLTDADKRLRDQFTPLDLMVQAENLPINEQVNVSRSLPPGAHGLDPSELFL